MNFILKPWYQIPIADNYEKLISIPCNINFIEPHPYLALGAPYKNKNSLWCLREGVVERLINANNYLQIINNDYSLIIYDSWRPVEVQAYMFNFTFDNECKKRGLHLSIDNINSYPEIIKEVQKYWAYPSFDDNTPPPHSTGGAVDLTMIDSSGDLIDMGCNIDSMDKSACPDFYKNCNSEEAILWNERRMILREAMLKYGFVQHPNEWWHFSFGDQLWAWSNKNEEAIYGRIS
tara:strand:- start:2751 stop:3452 length:702 start_codon:yes stop_codon:yes gene_type:complete